MELAWLASLALPWAAAAGLAAMPRSQERLAAPLAVTATSAILACVAIAAALDPPGIAPEVVFRASWLPDAPWIVVRDGLSSLFALLSAAVAWLVTVYAWGYLGHAQQKAGSHRREAHFYALLLAFLGAMLGLVSAGGLVQLYVFWELTGVSSYLLIGFWHHREAARSGAMQALVITAGSGLLLLVGLLGLAAERGGALPEALAGGAPVGEAVAALIVAGALAKSAQLPFSQWLPGAMAAPTPVSAFLHSTALVAAGVFLLARLYPAIGHTSTWSVMLCGSGALGVLLGGLLAVGQREAKALLAWSTVAQYALLFVAFGLGDVEAGLYAFVLHGAIKAGLFLVAGAATHASGADRLDEMGGLGRAQPLLAVAGVALALSLAGAPGFGGFHYKEALLAAPWDRGAWALVAVVLAGDVLTAIYASRFAHALFFAPSPGPEPHPLPARMRVPVYGLAGIAVLAGLAPGALDRLVGAAAASARGAPTDFHVSWHWTPEILLVIAAIASGLALFRLRLRGGRFEAPTWLPTGLDVTSPVVWAWAALSERALDLHGGDLRRYVRAVAVGVMGLVALLWGAAGPRLPFRPELPPLALSLILLLTVAAALAAALVRHHLVAIVALTLSGYALGAAYALFHAPGVALVQVLVETLATISLAVALWHARPVHPERTARVPDDGPGGPRVLIAGVVGVVIAAGVYQAAAVDRPADPVAATYLADGARLTGMTDIVTAIVTDFRSLDTVVELLVFATVSFGIYAIFSRRRGPVSE